MVYFCQECGYESSKWMGQCPGCKAWNSFAEEPVSTGKKASGGGKSVSRQQSEPVILKEISLKEDERQTTKIGELDRVLGGGIVPGSLVLVGGDPGIGKSTLLLQVCRNLTENGSSVLYISGEESLRQIFSLWKLVPPQTNSMPCIQDTGPSTWRIHSRTPDKNRLFFYFSAFYNFYFNS